MKLSRQELLERASRVDWLSAGQRLLVFCREIRGDARRDIDTDHEEGRSRGERLRQTVEELAEKMGAKL
jgi:hypothetical protein